MFVCTAKGEQVIKGTGDLITRKDFFFLNRGRNTRDQKDKWKAE